MSRFERLWKRLEKATEENDIETINKTTEDIEKELHFISEEEHMKWIEQLELCMDWDKFKEDTFRIAKRKTTRYQAEKLYKIVNWIDPYSNCSLDKAAYIKSFMSISLEDNIKDLTEYILEGYESVEDLLKDTELLRQYLNIVKDLKRGRK